MITKLVVVFTIIIWIVYDIFAGKLAQPTESMVLRDWAWDWTALSFTVGFLVGHWLFTRQNVDVSGWMWVIPIWGALLIFDIIWQTTGMPHIHMARYPGLYALAGIPVGSFLWGQNFT